MLLRYRIIQQNLQNLRNKQNLQNLQNNPNLLNQIQMQKIKLNNVKSTSFLLKF